MPHYDRGVYEPGDEVRVFDGSEEEEDVEGSRLPLLIVLALLVLAMFAGVVWLAYTQGVARGRSETPGADGGRNGPARVAPANPGGAAEPYKGFKIYEQPAPPDDDTDSTRHSCAARKPAAPAAPAAKPAAPAASANAPPRGKGGTAAARGTRNRAPAAAATPPPIKMAAATPAPKPAPVAKPRLAPRSRPPVGPATAPPRQLIALRRRRPPHQSSLPLGTGASWRPRRVPAVRCAADRRLQIPGRRRCRLEGLQGQACRAAVGLFADVQQADLGDKGIWYRLRIAGFPSKDVASALCDRLKADGGSCFLGK